MKGAMLPKFYEPESFIKVRGFPIAAKEIERMQQEFGAQLFDESMFEGQTKKFSCLNVIRELDLRLAAWRAANPKRDVPSHREAFDIGDQNWLYFPVSLQTLSGLIQIKTPMTKELPAGRVGWFRFRRHNFVRNQNYRH